MSLLLVLLGCALVYATESCCLPSVTKVSGKLAPSLFYSGDLIFSEEFTTFDFEKWQHGNTLSGGGNWEFQWYNNNRSNSFVDSGRLHIRPSLLSDQFGENFLTSGKLNVEGGAPADQCTDAKYWGCERIGTEAHVLNPIKSALVRTVESFSFTYGTLEVRAKMPAGDWLWPAIWLMPSHNAYGTWPASGEIDLIEARGNRQLKLNDVNIGAEQVGSTVHYGPYPALNKWENTHWTKNSAPKQGYDQQFHRYRLEWTPDHMKFSLDDVEIGRVTPESGGFWQMGAFDTNLLNPWRYGTKMAPFDQTFYIIINLAVGGVTFFPDAAVNPTRKPWANESPQAATDFWNNRISWLPTWKLNANDDADLQVDYVRVWAL